MDSFKSFKNPLAAYLEGTASASQKSQVEEWAEGHPTNEYLLQSLASAYEARKRQDHVTIESNSDHEKPHQTKFQ